MTGPLRVTMTRLLAASPAAVWQALTEPALLARWWGPAGFTCPRVELELEVGGSYRIEMQPPAGSSFFLHGEFREVAPPSRLAFTFLWDPPDPDDRETVATLTLTEIGGATELALDQGPFATEARRALHRGGWTDSLDKLAVQIRGGTSLSEDAGLSP